MTWYFSPIHDPKSVPKHTPIFVYLFWSLSSTSLEFLVTPPLIFKGKRDRMLSGNSVFLDMLDESRCVSTRVDELRCSERVALIVGLHGRLKGRREVMMILVVY
jgi:CheY-specific phosphatase CheX